MPQPSVFPLKPCPWTMIITLYERALDAVSINSILDDGIAAGIAARLNFDREAVLRKISPLRINAVRTHIIDGITRQFLSTTPGATVVELGAGLSSRCVRLDNGIANWISVDLPETMAVRREFFADGPRHLNMAGSAFGKQWLALAKEKSRGPVLVIAEGIFQYCESEEINKLLADIPLFLEGATVLFDRMSAPLSLFGRTKLNTLRRPVRLPPPGVNAEISQISLSAEAVRLFELHKIPLPLPKPMLVYAPKLLGFSTELVTLRYGHEKHAKIQ